MRTPSPPPSSSPEIDTDTSACSAGGKTLVQTTESGIENPISSPATSETQSAQDISCDELSNLDSNQGSDSSVRAEFKDPKSDFASRPNSERSVSSLNLTEDTDIGKGGALPDSGIVNLHTDSDSGGESINSRKAPFSLWNAVVRGPMQRIQERLLGYRWGYTAEESMKSSIWFLGVCYSMSEDGNSTNTEAYADFLIDYNSRIWMTYRKGFEALGPAKITSDVNWGCMIRSGQMLFAQALICHFLGRNWRMKSNESNPKEYLRILQYFGDSPSKECPFSIHNIVEVGAPYGLVAGSWLGPYALCRSLEALVHAVQESNDAKIKCEIPMKVHVISGDADGERGGAPCICMDDVEGLCLKGDVWTPIILLVPLVLGVDKVNARYLPSLWATFTFPQSLGILGGKHGASTYFVGVQGDHTFYLDPHEVQQVAVVSSEDPDVNTSSYHCSFVRKMPLNAIDPSLALGFYCIGRGDFEDLCKRASELEKDSNGAPMFTVIRSSQKDTRPKADTIGPVNLDQPEEDWQIL